MPGAAAARACSLSSHAHTVAPLASSAAAVALPVRPRPSRATTLPATSGMRMGCGTSASGPYRSFKVERPISASTAAMIQKRMTMVGSAQPFFSK